MKPATDKARQLRAKLQALADRGIGGEMSTAKRKLAQLCAAYDFTGTNGQRDLFAGRFDRALQAADLMSVERGRMDFAISAKWAIEQATGISCQFAGDRLQAHAKGPAARQLGQIANTVVNSFATLWEHFSRTAAPSDRAPFVAGLYDGMMNENRNGQMVPRRPRAKSKDSRPGLAVHPYSVAVELGKQIRFCTALDVLTRQLDSAVKGQIE